MSIPLSLFDSIQDYASEIQRRVQQEIQSGQSIHFQRMKLSMGQRLKDLIQESYLTKSSGGIDEAGEQWSATKKFQTSGGRMLIVSRRLLEGFQVEPTETGFRIVNRVKYAPQQFSMRSAYPQELPARWLSELKRSAIPHLTALVREIVDQIDSTSAVSSHLTARRI